MSFFEYDFTGHGSLVRGDDFKAAFNWGQAPGPGVPTVPVNLTGWTGVVNLYAPGNDSPIATVPAVLDALGNISFTISHVITATLVKGDLLYSLVLTDSLGFIQTRVRGKIRVI